MKYSKIFENIDFFYFFGLFICILPNNGGQKVQTFQKIDPLVMTNVLQPKIHL